MGIRLVRGRFFTDHDRKDSPLVTVVSETLARHIWPNEDPIGKRLKQGWPESEAPWREVVGVVSDVKVDDLTGQPRMQSYLPLAQYPYRRWRLVIRTQGEPLSVATEAISVIHSLDHDLPVYDVLSMEDLISRSILTQRIAAILLESLAVLAMVLAAIGINGVVAYGVSQRSHELGLRLALGARRGQVIGMILRQSMMPVVVGSGLGLAGAVVLTRLMSTLLFGVKPTDPLTFVTAVFALAVVGVGSCYLPARRAAKLDPLVALRCE
jgi:putative ABC transport system permease protein